MRSLIRKLLLASLLITASQATLAAIDDNAAQVALRVSCTENGTTMAGKSMSTVQTSAPCLKTATPAAPAP